MNKEQSLTRWIGRTETVDDVINAAPVAAMAATLDEEVARPTIGEKLPPLWHWLFFLPLTKQSSLGPDGHAKRGEFLPPIDRPRRMWAGSQFEFRESLRVGDAVRRRSEIVDITDKIGRSGPMTFVKVRHDIFRGQSSNAAITEFHDIVYRDAPTARLDHQPSSQAPSSSTWSKTIIPDDILLFRYSALTFNSHRIHYDRKYVTETEGYPGLIVHGPLIATLLIDLIRKNLPSRSVEAFEFKAVFPIFDLNAFSIHGELINRVTAKLWARDHMGRTSMRAAARISG